MKEKCYKYRKLLIMTLCVLTVCSMAALLYSPKQKDSGFHEPDYHLAFVVGEQRNRSWDNVKRGAEMAAADYNASLIFKTMDAEMLDSTLNVVVSDTLHQQLQAIIIAPNAALTTGVLPKAIPIILAHDQVNLDDSFPYIGCAYDQVGMQLAEEINRHGNYHKTIYVLQEEQETASRKLLKQGFEKELKNGDNQVQYLTYEEAVLLFSKQEALKDPVLVAFDVTQLEKAIDITSTYQNIEVYGVGNSDKILHAVEKGVIQSTVVQDDFSIGYLSVETAIQAIERKRHQDSTIRFSLIDKESIYSKENEKLMFPFHR